MDRLLKRLLTPDPNIRPSAPEVLQDPFVKPMEAKILEEEKLIAKIKELETILEYDHRKRRDSAAYALSGAVAATSAAAAGSPSPAAGGGAAVGKLDVIKSATSTAVAGLQFGLQNVADMLKSLPFIRSYAEAVIPKVQPYLTQSHELVRLALRWLYLAVLFPDQLLDEKRRTEDKDRIGLLVCNIITWFPVLLTLAGFLMGLVLGCLEQAFIAVLIAVLCPFLTAIGSEKWSAIRARGDAAGNANLVVALSLGSILGAFLVTSESLPSSSSHMFQFVYGSLVIVASSSTYYIARVLEAAGMRVFFSPSMALHASAGVTLGVAVSSTAALQDGGGPYLSADLSQVLSSLVVVAFSFAVVKFPFDHLVADVAETTVFGSFLAAARVPVGVTLLAPAGLYGIYGTDTTSLLFFYTPTLCYTTMAVLMHLMLQTVSFGGTPAKLSLPLVGAFRGALFPVAVFASFGVTVLWSTWKAYAYGLARS